MPRLLRFPPENDSLVEVTHRCAGGQMLLRPSPRVNAIIGGVYAVAAEKYAVRVVGVVALGNHLHAHLLVPDSQVRALFMQYTASNIALEINKLLGRRGHFWERRYQSSPIVGADAEEARMRYLVSNGVKEGLVGRVVQWPGIHSAREMLSGDPIEGIWEDRTQAWELRRQGQRVSRKDVTRKTALHLAPLPSWRGLSVEERRERVVAIIQEVESAAAAEREKTGRAPMGVKRIPRRARSRRRSTRSSHRGPRSSMPTARSSSCCSSSTGSSWRSSARRPRC